MTKTSFTQPELYCLYFKSCIWFFKLYVEFVTVPNGTYCVIVQYVGITVFLVQCRLYVYEDICLYVLYI